MHDVTGFTDHAQQILEAVVKDLSASQIQDAQAAKSMGRAPKLMEAPETAAQTHGFVHVQSGYEINHMASEYRALLASVLRECAGSFLDMEDCKVGGSSTRMRRSNPALPFQRITLCAHWFPLRYRTVHWQLPGGALPFRGGIPLANFPSLRRSEANRRAQPFPLRRQRGLLPATLGTGRSHASTKVARVPLPGLCDTELARMTYIQRCAGQRPGQTLKLVAGIRPGRAGFPEDHFAGWHMDDPDFLA
jgi:hypothetical protein